MRRPSRRSRYIGIGRCGRGGTRVDELHGHWIDAQVESFERSGAEKYQVVWLPKHHFVICRRAPGVDECRAGPPGQYRSIRLAKTHLFQPGNPERPKNCPGEPGERSARVHKRRSDQPTLQGLSWIGDLHVSSKRAHFIWHASSRVVNERYRNSARITTKLSWSSIFPAGTAPH